MLPERIEAKIDRTDTCWLWTAAVTVNGYPRTRYGGQQLMAHRVVYELLVGPIPEGLTLDHLCRVPSCVNPNHLEPVTIKENILRGNGLAARNARKTHCVNGHPFDADNTFIRRGASRAGTRLCRTCHREAARRHREKKRHV